MGNCVYSDGGQVCGKPTVGAGRMCAAHISSGKMEAVVTPMPTRDGESSTWGHMIERHHKADIPGGSGRQGGGGEIS